MALRTRCRCGCYTGLGGMLCEEPREAFCLSQCSGRGECVAGFCRCLPGAFGADCASTAAGAPPELQGRAEQGARKGRGRAECWGLLLGARGWRGRAR